MDLVKEIAYDIWGGNIAVKPKRISRQITSCTYCPYKTICMFDESLDEKYAKLKEYQRD